MSKIDIDILSGLTDEDIKILCNNGDLNLLMEPIKHNAKQYSKYMSMLGRLDKKSVLAKKNMPRIASELYKEGDINYTKLISKMADNMRADFAYVLNDCLGESISPKDIEAFQLSDYTKLVSEILKSTESNLDIDLFYLQAKLNGLDIDEEMKKEITNEWYHISEMNSIRREILN